MNHTFCYTYRVYTERTEDNTLQSEKVSEKKAFKLMSTFKLDLHWCQQNDRLSKCKAISVTCDSSALERSAAKLKGGFLKASQPLKTMLSDKRREKRMRPSAQFYENLKHIHMPNNAVHFSNIQNNKYRGRQSFQRPKYKKNHNLENNPFILQSYASHLWFYSLFRSSQKILFPSFLLSSSFFCSHRTQGSVSCTICLHRIST